MKQHILNTILHHKQQFINLGVSSLGLFGSYKNNTATSHSDIDILIDFKPEAENFDNYISVCFLLENMFQDKKVDIVTKNGLSPYIGPKILKEVEYVKFKH